MEVVVIVVFVLVLGSAIVVFGKKSVAKSILGITAIVVAVVVVLSLVSGSYVLYQRIKEARAYEAKFAMYERIGACLRTEDPENTLRNYPNTDLGKRAIERINNNTVGMPEDCEAFKEWYRSARSQRDAQGYTKEQLLEMGAIPISK